MPFKRPARRENTRRVSVYIPARYTLRPSRAERVVPLLLLPLGVFLLLACLLDGPEFDPALPWFLLILGALIVACPLWALLARETRLEVDGEALAYHRRKRPVEEFTFSQVAFVQAREGRETLVLWDQRRQVLCRLHVTMDGLEILLADLRRRGTLFLPRAPKGWDQPLPPADPGPRKEELDLDLPARAPEAYCLRYPGLYTAIFVAAGLFFCAAALACFWMDVWPVALAVLLFPLGAFGALAWVRRERIQVRGDRILRRPGWGAEQEIRFSDVAAAQLRTYVTGLGSLSSVRLLDGRGQVLLSPGVGMEGTAYLLADLIDRGVPLTY